jgi:hypothetical protein
LANHARFLQREARAAIARGEFTRASALIGDAELLAEDVHSLVGDMERRELGELARLAIYDVRPEPAPAPRYRPEGRPHLARRMRIAIGAGLAMSLALAEW